MKDITPTLFTNSKKQSAYYYFHKNPWKRSSGNDFQKVFRYCVSCGENRFTEEQWSGEYASKRGVYTIGSTLVCDKNICYEAVSMLPAFIERKHYIVKTRKDQERIYKGKSCQYFETDIPIFLEVNDNVYNSDNEIDPKYRTIIKLFETLPIGKRIETIDFAYFDYQRAMNIEVGKLMTDTTDPYLSMLAEYRQKVVALSKL